MRNPNGPSIDEKEAMQDQLADLNESSLKDKGKFWLVVRRYRDTERVLFMSANADLGRAHYYHAAETLRSGDVMLWECSLTGRVLATSGGYNRTRW